MNSELKIVKLADPTTVSFFLRFAGVLMHRLGLVLCILHVDLTLDPASYVSSITSSSEAGGSRASSSNLFSKGFTDAGIFSATILLTAFGEAGAFPPSVFLLSLLCSSNSFFVWIFKRFQYLCIAFMSRLFPSGFPALKGGFLNFFPRTSFFFLSYHCRMLCSQYQDIVFPARQEEVFLPR